MSIKPRPSSSKTTCESITAYLMVILFLFHGLTIQDLSAKTLDLNTPQETKEDSNEVQASSQQEKLAIARQEYKLGLEDFKAKRYREALKRFIRVYRLQPHPNLVYNMARSFEELKEYQSAADYYRKYLKIQPNTPDRAQIEMTIVTMENLAKPSAQPTGHSERFLSKRMAWSGVAMGSIMIIGGAMFGVQALNRSDSLNSFKAGDSLQAFARTYQERDQAALLSDLFMISGVAISSIGLYFALKAPPVTTSSDKASISLSFTGQGLSIQGAF